MKKNFLHSVTMCFTKERLSFLGLLLLLCFASCQNSDNTETEETTATEQIEQTPVDSVRLAARRPHPDFYILTPALVKDRVFICDDPYSDIFHIDYACEVVGSCNTNIKNVTLLNAIRKYGRYNCKTCSAHLHHIFDENLIR